MPPRGAVRRPSAASSLKKKPPRDEKEEKEFVVGDIDGSERLELEDNEPQSDAEDNMAHYVGTEEERHEQRVDGDDGMMGDMMDGEDEEEMGEDLGVEHKELMGGYEEEHHDVVKERRKRKEFEVFVGGLDRDVREDDLFHFFRQVGDITEVRLMKNAHTKKNKGFAFIRFATIEQARRAIKELKHPVINGKQCGVAPSQDSDTLFVGNINKTWTKAALKEKLAYYGVDNYEDLTLVEDAKNEGMSRGFAFLDFSSRRDALEACKRLQKRDVVFGTERTARVAFADTFIEPDDDIMSQVSAIFIDGLPAAWDEDHVRDHLKKFGRIEKIELARNMPAAKRMDFGFVTFGNHDAAVACVNSINNSELGDGERLVKVRARLSRPRQRGKSAKHAQGGYLVARDTGQGFKAPWGSSSSRMDSRRFTGHGGRSMQTHGAYDSGLKRPIDPRDRHPMMEMVPTRVGSRRRFPSPESSFGRRSSDPVYEKSSTKRECIQHAESFSKPRVFVRGHVESRYYRDTYSSHGSEYLDSPRSFSRAAGHRAPIYDDDDDYDQYFERPSNDHDSHRHDYCSISSSKRSHSAMEEVHSRYAEPPVRHSRARFDYRGSNSRLPYDDHYGSDSTSERRMAHGSHPGYDGGIRSSFHSRGMYERRTSNSGYRRALAEDISWRSEDEMYSSYDRDYMPRDYMPSRSELGTGSYPSHYPSRRMNDGYMSGRGSDSYY